MANKEVGRRTRWNFLGTRGWRPTCPGAKEKESSVGCEECRGGEQDRIHRWFISRWHNVGLPQRRHDIRAVHRTRMQNPYQYRNQFCSEAIRKLRTYLALVRKHLQLRYTSHGKEASYITHTEHSAVGVGEKPSCLISYIAGRSRQFWKQQKR